MSKFVVCTVFDSKVQAFEQPFFARTRGEALRMWQEVSNDAQTKFARHPEDFALMEIAEYDDQTAQFVNHSAPQNLGLAVQFKRPPESGAPLFEARKSS
jgi:hypothetical protein